MTPAQSDAPAAPKATPKTVASDSAPKRRLIVRPDAPKPGAVPREVLIIASRLKEYVRARAGYNTSDRVLEALSEIVRAACDDAIDNASREGRKTILDRDVPDPK